MAIIIGLSIKEGTHKLVDGKIEEGKIHARMEAGDKGGRVVKEEACMVGRSQR